MNTVDDFEVRLEQYIDIKFAGVKKIFAEAVKIPPSHLSAYINGGRIPSGDVLKKFAAIGMNINWLLTGEGDMVGNNIPELAQPAPPRIHPDDIELIANNVFEKFKELFTINLTKSTN